MNDCIFGIKCNGVSIQVSSISIDDDQSVFDYICNVCLKDSWNGNGTYDVSIISKDYVQGLPIGKWRITKAWISYDWGASFARLKMEDEDGNETCVITADCQKGTASGFHVPSLARTIFTKAQKIVRDYPNATICTAIIDLHKSQKDLNADYWIKCLKRDKDKGGEDYIDSVVYVLKKVSSHLEVYNKTKELLKKQEDKRSKQLLKEITTNCKNLLEGFNDCR